MESSTKIRNFLLSVLILALWIWGLNWLFSRYAGESYFIWYIKNGTVISSATAFLALIWGKLDQEQKDLLTWHPLLFLGTCGILAGVLYQALASTIGRRAGGDNFSYFDSLDRAAVQWDDVLALVTSVLMAIAVFGWLVVVAPLFYVLTLVTGAPARREMRGTGRRVLVIRKNSRVKVKVQPSWEPLAEGAVDVTLGNQPFAMTNAINAPYSSWRVVYSYILIERA